MGRQCKSACAFVLCTGGSARHTWSVRMHTRAMAKTAATGKTFKSTAEEKQAKQGRLCICTGPLVPAYLLPTDSVTAGENSAELIEEERKKYKNGFKLESARWKTKLVSKACTAIGRQWAMPPPLTSVSVVPAVDVFVGLCLLHARSASCCSIGRATAHPQTETNIRVAPCMGVQWRRLFMVEHRG